jgi:hypothetical protein
MIEVSPAKPGYGKTILSATIIEDLDVNPHNSTEPVDYLPSTAFFHFESEEPLRRRSTEVLRAVAAQLIHARRKERITIDALCMLIDTTGSGQLCASNKDVQEVLTLLMEQYPTYLVFGGVDECVDSGPLLSKVFEVCQIVDSKVLLLSRPNQVFPISYRRVRDHLWVVQLPTLDNTEDIRSFLGENLENMFLEELFGEKPLPETVLADIIIRSNGMFLWARLLLNYLYSPALTPRERYEAVLLVNLLEGIERLYLKILDALGGQFQREKEVAADIFKWISASCYPLSIAVLHTALAIVLGQPISDLGYLLDFKKSLSKSHVPWLKYSTPVESISFTRLSKSS